MKLARFRPAGKDVAELGVLLGEPLDAFVPFAVLEAALPGGDAPKDLRVCLAWSSAERKAVAEAAAAAPALPLSEGTLLAPLKPEKCLAIGLNYKAHAEEFGGTVAPYPTVFTKQVSCITGPLRRSIDRASPRPSITRGKWCWLSVSAAVTCRQPEPWRWWGPIASATT